MKTYSLNMYYWVHSKTRLIKKKKVKSSLNGLAVTAATASMFCTSR